MSMTGDNIYLLYKGNIVKFIRVIIELQLVEDI